ncbi:neuronal acetylcholine receptor subunit alpha-9-ii [Plakobranchus ocellatus]|uniref:Neuronal acetylcholine receptor subunit alpha-9-ii n=1 Tax=Plakobranchus ocellatus TaxID=259542 RepID=A0AAV4DU57_9GAST|nr:neuronal acetylcholine receptor subunit alpha-9-ii [Plakobranchus ocellatus]
MFTHFAFHYHANCVYVHAVHCGPGIYYGMTIFIVSFATAMTVFTLNIHHKGARGKAVPMIIKKICFDGLAKLFCMRVDTWDDNGVDLVSTEFSPDCNGVPSGSSNYIRLKVANKQETDPSSMELKQPHEMSHVNRVEIPPLLEHDHQVNGALPPRPVGFPGFRRSFGGFNTASAALHTSAASNSSSSSASIGGAEFSPPDLSQQTQQQQQYHSQQPLPPQQQQQQQQQQQLLQLQLQQQQTFELYFSRVLQRVYQTIEQNDIRLAEKDKREGIKLEWQQVAQITDRLLLTCFVCVTLTITAVVLLVSPASVDV